MHWSKRIFPQRKSLKFLFIILGLIVLNIFYFYIQTDRETITQKTNKIIFTQSIEPPGVLLKLRGGIGNQLFLYACSYALAKEKNLPLYLVSNSSARYSQDRKFTFKQREFALDQFSIPKITFYNGDDKLKNIKIYTEQEVLAGNLKTPSKSQFIQLEKDHFCQSEAFWIKFAQDITAIFQPSETVFRTLSAKAQEVLHEIVNTESVAVHVRRGDFLKENYAQRGFIVPISFQRIAIRRMLKLLSVRGIHSPNFYVFSDDIKFAQEKFSDLSKHYKFVYVSQLNTTSIQELALMSKCKNIILPNSTFSWWAAYLNLNPDKIVIASAFNPAFLKEKSHQVFHGTGYHPSSWTVINVFAGER